MDSHLKKKIKEIFVEGLKICDREGNEVFVSHFTGATYLDHKPKQDMGLSADHVRLNSSAKA